jgi:hypothetical protein
MRKILKIAKLLVLGVLLTLLLSLASFLAGLVVDCARCCYAYPSLLCVLQLLLLLVECGIVGVSIFFAMLYMVMVTGQID